MCTYYVNGLIVLNKICSHWLVFYLFLVIQDIEMQYVKDIHAQPYDENDYAVFCMQNVVPPNVRTGNTNCYYTRS